MPALLLLQLLHHIVVVFVVSFSPTSKLVSVSTQSLNNNQKHPPHGCTNSIITPGTTGFLIGWVSSLPVNPQTAFQAICQCSAYVMYVGVAYSQALPYVFGLPFMNETVMEQGRIRTHQLYDYHDRNASEWMMYLWMNFITEGLD